MANLEHINILKQGVETWNKWMGEHYLDSPPISKEPDLEKWDGSFLREFDYTRFTKEYDYTEGSGIYGPAEQAKNWKLFNDYKNGTFPPALKKFGWRTLDNIDLSYANLSGADFSEVNLRNANLFEANLSFANLKGANLSGANLKYATLRNAQLNNTNFENANFFEADFTDAQMQMAVLKRADLTRAKFTNANLTGGNLEGATLVETIFENSNISECKVYGISSWNLKAEKVTQKDLIITPESEEKIYVDNLEVAQFLYLILKNEKIRQVIDTITSKVVLILGRFIAERKLILDALREELRRRNYLPILFDFEKPSSRDLTETISTIAHLSRFIIADLTDAKSIPQELLQIVPDLPSVPVQPILLASEYEYAMFEHFRRYPWVLNTYLYNNSLELLNELSIKVIEPAELKVLQMKPVK